MLRKSKFFYVLVVIFVFIIAFLLRIYDLRADLPPNISISGSIYTDEGNQCHNSRSKYLFNEWFPDEWKITNYNPVLPFIKLLVFKLFGVGLFQIRMINVIFSILTLIFFYLSLLYMKNFYLSTLGLFLLGTNFLYTMYNRIGTFETSMIFWMVLSIFFLKLLQETKNPICGFLSGSSAYMAVIFKMTGMHFLPVPIVSAIFYYFFSEEAKGVVVKKKITNIFSILLGSFVVFIAWYLIFFLPNKDWIRGVPGKYIGNQMFPKSIRQAFLNALGFNWKEQFYKIPVVWILSLLAVYVFFRNLIKRKFNLVEISFFLYFFTHTAAFMIMNHRPTRYLVPVIPAMVFMVVYLVKEIILNKIHNSKYSKTQKIVIFIFDIAWGSFFAYYCIIPLMNKISLRITNSIYNIIISSIVILIVGKLFFFFTNKINLKPLLIVFLIGSASFLISMNYFRDWLIDRTHYVYNMEIELKKKLKNAYIAGLTAPVAVLESKHKALFLYPGFVNWHDDTLEKYKITHALLASFNWEINMFFDQWPDIMKRAKLIKVYNVKDQFLHFYSFVFPYVKSVRKVGMNSFIVKVMNPPNSEINEINLGYVLYNSNDDYKIIELNKDVKVKKGVNSYPVKIKDLNLFSNILFFTFDKKWGYRYKYEAEKFPMKIGKNERWEKFSSKYGRCTSRFTRDNGFIISSINGNFIDYGEGFMEVDFVFFIKKYIGKVKKIAMIEIYDNDNKQVLDNLVIKGYMIKNRINKFIHFKLKTPIFNDFKNIEFRVFNFGNGSFCVDYINLSYFQGKWFKNKK